MSKFNNIDPESLAYALVVPAESVWDQILMHKGNYDMNKYRLKQWYPALRDDMKVGNIIVSENDKKVNIGCGKTKVYVYQGKEAPYYIPRWEVENNPEFWEPVVEKNTFGDLSDKIYSYEEPVVEKDYEILSFIDEKDYLHEYKKGSDNPRRYCRSNGHLGQKSFGWYGSSSENYCLDNYRIHSVKRLSDGEVFTVGDRVKSVLSSQPFTIHSIKAVNEQTLNSVTFFSKTTYVPNCFLGNARKLKEPLFITEDGAGVCEGDECWRVDTIKYSYELIPKEYISNHPKDRFIYFKDQDIAKEWVRENRPRYSKADIKRVASKLDDHYETINSTIGELLLREFLLD